MVYQEMLEKMPSTKIDDEDPHVLTDQEKECLKELLN